MSQLVRVAVQIAVAELLLLKDQRDGSGGAFYLRLKQLMDAVVVGVVGCRVVPLHQKLMAFICGQQRQQANGLRRIGHNPTEQRLQVAHHTLDHRAVETGCIIGEHARQIARNVKDGQRQRLWHPALLTADWRKERLFILRPTQGHKDKTGYRLL